MAAQPGAAPEAAPLEGKLKIIGVGVRGSSAVDRLHARGCVAGAELWCLDNDRRALEACAAPNSVLLDAVQEGASALDASEAARLVGAGAADRDGRGNVNVGDGGVAFVLAAAAGTPGGPDTLLHLVRELRAGGHFTAAAVTRPFAFEGGRKAEAAVRLVASLQDAAHLVAVIDQDVLTHVGLGAGGAPMTMAEATLIADNALEHTVRTVLAALTAPELLKSTRGALVWHGRDLRRYRRLLSPPLQRLLTCPGTAALGRGAAAMPAAAADRLGAPGALAHLASDAVRAAAESPFLEVAGAAASAVLCCLSLPPPRTRAAGASGLDYDVERSAARTAVQAAAGALLAVSPCDDIVLCAQPRSTLEGDDGDNLRVEASLMVLHNPAAAPPEAAAPTDRMGATPGATRLAAGPPPPPRVQRLPASSWNAMSALAGGAPQRHAYAPAPARQPTPPAQPPLAPSSHASPLPAALAARPQPQPQPSQPAWAGQQPARAPSPDSAMQPNLAHERRGAGVSVGGYLTDALTAQSLDLPPAAAQWRQQQRSTSEVPRPRLIIREAADAPLGDDAPAAGGLLGGLLGGSRPASPPVVPLDIRERAAGVLERDRGEVQDNI
ncbi:hypothetical protein WJX81_006281 [Elliptochloris bilobata]|uniref:Tubulin/FtsZ GTPase domain-containing protein n=1 Tax=Elliptochloris bilobata TaxID=381761 RepID=A0AAW1SLS5_9CHLO